MRINIDQIAALMQEFCIGHRVIRLNTLRLL